MNCAFSNCPNRNTINTNEKGIVFFAFRDMPPDTRDNWTKIVAKERRDPLFTPTPCSLMCSQHFASSQINKGPSFITLKKTAIPTLNIFTKEIIVNEQPDRMKLCDNYNNTICIIENQIPARVTAENVDVASSNDVIIIEDDHDDIAPPEEDKIVCVIENQISSVVTPTVNNDIDLEEQLQWNLVGTSTYLKELLQAADAEHQFHGGVDNITVTVKTEDNTSDTESKTEYRKALKRIDPLPQTFIVKNEINPSEIDVKVKVESLDSETESEVEFGKEYRQCTGKNMPSPKNMKTKTVVSSCNKISSSSKLVFESDLEDEWSLKHDELNIMSISKSISYAQSRSDVKNKTVKVTHKPKPRNLRRTKRRFKK